MLKSDRYCGILIPVIFFGASLSGAEPKAEQSVPNASTCQLNIDGKFIEKLILDVEGGGTKELARPASSVSLPAGRYRVRQVELEGKYRCSIFAAKKDDWFRLSPNQSHHLKVGAPLTPKVSATRQGRLIEIDYELLDACGRSYSARRRANPPTFAVFKDGQEIGSGTFEYG